MINRNKLTQLSEVMRKEKERKRIGDSSILVMHGGKEVYYHETGEIKRDSIFELFSMTKPITAVAVMILYERGFLDLLDPIEKYLPAFSDMKVMTEKGRLVKAQRKITILQCLNMTSGLVYPVDDCKMGSLMKRNVEKLQKKVSQGKRLSIKDVSEAIASAPLLYQPGTHWHYGISADVLGMIVSVISGKSLSEFMSQEIFEPLGMRDTGFLIPEEKKNRLATMYTLKDDCVIPADEKRLREIFRHGVTDEVPFEAGGSGLYSTIEDYALFTECLLQQGSLKERRILGRKTVEFMRSNQLTSEQIKDITMEHAYGYGYGSLMRVLMDKTPQGTNGSIGEYGWDGMAGSYFLIDPEEQLVVIYMQQVAEGQDESMRRKLRQIIYGAIE